MQALVGIKQKLMKLSHLYFAGRATMTMTTLLTLTAMFGAVRSNVPRVSYVSLLDIWMVACIVFVFLVIIHFMIVISLLRYSKPKAAEKFEHFGIFAIPLLFIVFNCFYWSLFINKLD